MKIIFHGQQIMAHDPCRRFVLGITTENTDMRLWLREELRKLEGFLVQLIKTSVQRAEAEIDVLVSILHSTPIRWQD